MDCLWLLLFRASLMAQMVKNPPATQETRVPSLGRKDPLEESMAPHSSIFPRESPWTKEPGGLQSMGSQRVRHDWVTFTHYCSTVAEPKNPKLFIVWPFTENFADLCCILLHWGKEGGQDKGGRWKERGTGLERWINRSTYCNSESSHCGR